MILSINFPGSFSRRAFAFPSRTYLRLTNSRPFAMDILLSLYVWGVCQLQLTQPSHHFCKFRQRSARDIRPTPYLCIWQCRCWGPCFLPTSFDCVFVYCFLASFCISSPEISGILPPFFWKHQQKLHCFQRCRGNFVIPSIFAVILCYTTIKRKCRYYQPIKSPKFLGLHYNYIYVIKELKKHKPCITLCSQTH